MKIGLIDVDGHNFPNLPLMKLSAYHKSRGDAVEWYEPMWSGHCDIVYVLKVFSFTPDYPYYIDAEKIIRGGSGYCIELRDGKEVYNATDDNELPPEIEHIYPDYSLYPKLTLDTAYGFLSRGCPRGCDFCHVKDKEGKRAYKVADLSEFWRGQKHIKLLDPNLLACKEHIDLLKQLIASDAWIDITQGFDIRLVNDENIEYIKQMKLKALHFAWDNPKDDLYSKFKNFVDKSNIKPYKLTCYVLTNFDSTLEQDLYRIYALRSLGIAPYVMIYDKQHAPDIMRKLQRWANNRFIFKTVERFEDYDSHLG